MGEQNEAMQNIAAAGVESGLESGMASGMGSGMASGMKSGMASGMKSGLASGMESGMASGMESGLASGMGSGMDQRMNSSSAQDSLMMSNTGIGSAMNMASGPKKSKTILTPHLECSDLGSMLIVLDNQQTSHPINEPITGKIKVNLKERFDANAVTLSLTGFQRSFFNRGVGAVAGQAAGQNPLTRLSKTVVGESFTIAEFPEGETTLEGQSEYAFSLTLPDAVCETLMLKFGEMNNLSVTFYLKA